MTDFTKLQSDLVRLNADMAVLSADVATLTSSPSPSSASPNGTTVTAPSSQSITDANGHVFVFSNELAPWGDAYKILRDGVWYVGSGSVLLTISNGIVWTQTSDSKWYKDNGSTWIIQSTGPTAVIPPTPSTPPITNTITFSTNSANNHIDTDYPGLSFEKEGMCVPNLWSAQNIKLISLLKLISPNMVMRFGANEFCRFNPNGSGTNYSIGSISEIAPINIQQLAGFVGALNAKLIYDVPIWGDSYNPSQEAAEIAYVDSVLGPSILFYQFGNEPDLNGAFNNNYWNKWNDLYSTVKQVVPNARFGGASCALPSSGDNNSTNEVWTGAFASMMSGKLSCLTHHYYALLYGQGGEYSNTQNMATVSPDTFLDAYVASSMQTICTRNSIPEWRMEECNSINQGGQDHYSNAFGAAIWVIDFAFQCAKYGCKGVNFHVGEYTPPYSPFDIDYGTGALTRIKPTFYGMLAVGQMLPGRLMDASSGLSSMVRAYGVANDDGSYSVATINTDSSPVTLTISLPRNIVSASSMVLTDIGGLSGYTYGDGYTYLSPINPPPTTFGGTSVQLDGTWNPTLTSVVPSGSSVTVTVPAQSAMLIKAK